MVVAPLLLAGRRNAGLGKQRRGAAGQLGIAGRGPNDLVGVVGEAAIVVEHAGALPEMDGRSGLLPVGGDDEDRPYLVLEFGPQASQVGFEPLIAGAFAEGILHDMPGAAAVGDVDNRKFHGFVHAEYLVPSMYEKKRGRTNAADEPKFDMPRRHLTRVGTPGTLDS
jgi:hypothetical protein